MFKTGKSFTSLAVAVLAAVSFGSAVTADDSVEFKKDRYIGDETGGYVSAIGQVSKSLIQQGGVVTVSVSYVVEQTVEDVNLVQTTKTEEVQLDVPVTVKPRLNPKKKIVGYDFVVLSDSIAPVSLVGADETAVSDPIIIRVDLNASVSVNGVEVATETEDLFDYYDVDDDDDDDDDDH